MLPAIMLVVSSPSTASSEELRASDELRRDSQTSRSLASPVPARFAICELVVLSCHATKKTTLMRMRPKSGTDKRDRGCHHSGAWIDSGGELDGISPIRTTFK